MSQTGTTANLYLSRHRGVQILAAPMWHPDKSRGSLEWNELKTPMRDFKTLIL